MIKVEYDKKTGDMVIDSVGDANIILNEYAAITESLFEGYSRMLGKDETERIIKKAYKKGLKRAIEAMEKEGK